MIPRFFVYTVFLYFFPVIYRKRGIRRRSEAHIHAPGSPKHTAAKASDDASESIGAPFTSAGRNEHITILAVSSAAPAPRTYAGRRRINYPR